MNKDCNNFWRCWKKKTCNKSPRTSNVAGCTANIDIANEFADYFSINCEKTNNSKDVTTFTAGDVCSSYDTAQWFFSVNDVRQVMLNSLKIGKAAGADNIAAEHIIYADPIIAYHLCNLFNLIIQHGHVPAQLGSGIIIPLIKDRHGDVPKLENYRAITLSCLISKLLEFCITLKCDSFLASNDLQFGFKKCVGCANAIYVLQQVVEHFNVRGSTVFISSFDASKAFDRVDHSTLFTKLLDRNVPMCIIKVLANWYGKLNACVRWNDIVVVVVAEVMSSGNPLCPYLYDIHDEIVSGYENPELLYKIN